MPIEFNCVICQQLVTLETIKTNENGQPVHEDCYIRNLAPSSEKPERERVAS